MTLSKIAVLLGFCFLPTLCSWGKSNVKELDYYYSILKESPIWWDLAASPIDGSISIDVQKSLVELQRCFGILGRAENRDLREAIRLYLTEQNPDKAAAKNRNVLVLNRFLFDIDGPDAYPILVTKGKIVIRPASAIIRSIDENGLREFDRFAKEKSRREIH